MTVNNRALVLLLTSAIIASVALIANYLIWATIHPPGWLCAAVLLVLISSLAPSIIEFKLAWPLLVIFIAMFLIALFTGSPSWDPRHIWLFHAKRIFYDGSLYAQMDNYANAANDYPVIIPALSATIASALGFWNEAAPKSAGIFFLIPPLIISLLALKNSIYFLVYISGIFYLCGEHLLNGEMDGILAVYSCTIAILIVLLSTTQEKKQQQSQLSWQLLFIILTLLSIISTLIKNEGLVISLAFLISIFTIGSLRSNCKLFLPFIFGILFYIVTWKISLIINGVTNDVANESMASNIMMRLQEPKSIELITRDFLNKSWGCLALLGGSLLLKRNSCPQYRAALCFIALYQGALFLIYLGTPHSLEWHIQTSSERTLLPINVTALGISLLILRDDVARIFNWVDEFYARSSAVMKASVLSLICVALLSPIMIFDAIQAKLDHPILFGKGHQGAAFLSEVMISDKKGWSSPEAWGVWATGNSSAVTLPLVPYMTTNKFNLFLRAYLPKSIDHQNFNLYINGRLVKTVTLNSEYTYIENIPTPQFWERRGPMSLSFSMEKTIAPNSIEESNDQRALSIGLIFASYQKVDVWEYFRSILDFDTLSLGQ